MKEESIVNPHAVSEESDTDVVSLLKRMQKQLLFLESKLDLLLSQAQERPSREKNFQDRPFRKKPFSKPPHSFGRPERHGKGEHGPSSREGDSTPGHFYDRRPRDKSRSPHAKRKPFPFKRKDRE